MSVTGSFHSQGVPTHPLALPVLRRSRGPRLRPRARSRLPLAGVPPVLLMLLVALVLVALVALVALPVLVVLVVLLTPLLRLVPGPAVRAVVIGLINTDCLHNHRGIPRTYCGVDSDILLLTSRSHDHRRRYQEVKFWVCIGREHGGWRQSSRRMPNLMRHSRHSGARRGNGGHDGRWGWSSGTGWTRKWLQEGWLSLGGKTQVWISGRRCHHWNGSRDHCRDWPWRTTGWWLCSKRCLLHSGQTQLCVLCTAG